MAAGSNPRPKPWERTGSASGPSPFKPPSNGNTSEVVEASGTAKPGEVVSTVNQTAAASTAANTLTRPGPRPWERSYGNTYGGSTLASGYGPGYGSGSGMFGGGYSGYGSGYGSGYVGNGYGNSMYNSGYSSYGGYSGNMYGNNMLSTYNRPMGYGGVGMGGMGPYGNPNDPNNPFGPPTQPPPFWQSFLSAMGGVVFFFGRIADLIAQNTQAFHMVMDALLMLFDKSGMLYGELARFIFRLLGIRTPARKNIDGRGPPSILGPKANGGGNSFDNDWTDDFTKGQ